MFNLNNFLDGSEYQSRQRGSTFSVVSRSHKNYQSSNAGASLNQLNDEISELRLDPSATRWRENSFCGQSPKLSKYNDPIDLTYQNPGGVFEEQQNFKLYFAHNNLNNVINPLPVAPTNRISSKKSTFLRVISVNNRGANKHDQLRQMVDIPPLSLQHLPA